METKPNPKDKIHERAKQLCTHTVVYTTLIDQLVVVRAMQGRTTRAIAQEFGITLSEAQYRIAKAQRSLGTYFRRDYRNGQSEIARQMVAATEKIGLEAVRHKIAPKFIPLAKEGVPIRVAA